MVSFCVLEFCFLGRNVCYHDGYITAGRTAIRQRILVLTASRCRDPDTHIITSAS